jgi:hypothetical protein
MRRAAFPWRYPGADGMATQAAEFPSVFAFVLRGQSATAQRRTVAIAPSASLRAGFSSSCDTEDESLHPMDSKARQKCLAGPCNSHDALPAGRRCPSQLKKARLERQRYSSSGPPIWRWSNARTTLPLAVEPHDCFRSICTGVQRRPGGSV